MPAPAAVVEGESAIDLFAAIYKALTDLVECEERIVACQETAGDALTRFLTGSDANAERDREALALAWKAQDAAEQAVVEARARSNAAHLAASRARLGDAIAAQGESET